jgi:anti-sigma regulatory factor (Ser/Thr protein kinase)
MERLPLDLSFNDNGFVFGFVDATVARYARKLFSVYLAGQVEPDCDMYIVELVFGELVGNVARHAPGPLQVRVVWQDVGARLEVLDHGSGYELKPMLPVDPLAESHRGLFIVASYTEDLRVERWRGGSVTSAILPVRRARSGRDAQDGRRKPAFSSRGKTSAHRSGNSSR